MKRGMYFGGVSLSLLGFHGLVCLTMLAGFPYFYTLFYIVPLLLSFLMGLLGYFERDTQRWPALAGMILSGVLFGHWLAALLLRLAA